MKHLLSVILIAVVMQSCLTTRVSSTETKANEAIIFGRIIIDGDNPQISCKNVQLNFFSEDGSPVLAITDGDGYFYTKSPLGKLYFEGFHYNKGLKAYTVINNDMLNADISNGDEVFYVGDIKAEWTISDIFQTNKLKLEFKTPKPLRETLPNTPCSASIENESITFFMNKFTENKKKIRISLLKE